MKDKRQNVPEKRSQPVPTFGQVPQKPPREPKPPEKPKKR